MEKFYDNKKLGTKYQDTPILLHGGGLSWWSCQKAATLFVAQHFQGRNAIYE
jgi:hypothetical protein